MIAVPRLLPTSLLLLALPTPVACNSEGNENASNVQVVKQGNAEIVLTLPERRCHSVREVSMTWCSIKTTTYRHLTRYSESPAIAFHCGAFCGGGGLMRYYHPVGYETHLQAGIIEFGIPTKEDDAV